MIGSTIAVPEEPFDLSGLSVRTIVEGRVVAENEVRNMTFSPAEIVSFHSRVMTLEPADLFSTGTPGAGTISPGDRVRAEIDSIGRVTADVTRCPPFIGDAGHPIRPSSPREDGVETPTRNILLI